MDSVKTDINEGLASAIRMLAPREHSRFELQTKLLKRYSEDIVIEILAQLVADNLLSDKRYTEQYLSFRIAKGYGPIKLQKELSDKGIDQSLYEEQLSELSIDWMQQLRSVRQSKFGSAKEVSEKALAKQARFLSYRGFPSDMIHRVLFRD